MARHYIEYYADDGMTIFSDETERLLESLPEASPMMRRLLGELAGAFPKPVREGKTHVIYLPGHAAEQKEPAQE